MENQKNTIIANGILSAFVGISGIIVCSLTSQICVSFFAFWAIGFAYIIPGVIGVIASFTKQTGLFITQMVLLIISLIVMGIFFFVGILAIIGLANARNVCLNRNGCQLNESVYAIAVSIPVFYVLGWIGALAACITGGILACSRSSTGTVMQPHQMTTTTTFVQMGPPNQSYVMSPGQPGYGVPVGQPGYGVPVATGQPYVISQPGYGPNAGYAQGPPQYTPQANQMPEKGYGM